MTLRKLILTFALLIPLSVLGQERDTIFRNDTIAIHGLPITATVAVIDKSQNFIITIDYEHLASFLKTHTQAHDVEWDNKLLKILNDDSKTIEQRLEIVHSDPVMNGRLRFQTLDLLKTGKCIVLNRISEAIEQKMIFQEYQKKWWTGARFLTVEGDIIFDIRTGAF